MTFEEFFKKKKISLPALQAAEGALFAEFKEHYELMGEKSFDHTKKYWFNKLRRLYPLPPEPKVEKVVMENKMAEQTIADTLTEPAPTSSPKVGFTPRFRAGATTNKIAEPPQTPEEKSEEEKPAAAMPAKPGFTPRFKPGVTKPAAQPPAETQPDEARLAETDSESSAPNEAPAPKMVFKPRFKAGVTGMKTSDVSQEQLANKDIATSTPEVNQAAAEQQARREQNPGADASEAKPEFQQEKEAAQEAFGSEERVPQKLSPEEFIEDMKPIVEEKQPEDQPAPKLGFKPRFKPPTT